MKRLSILTLCASAALVSSGCALFWQSAEKVQGAQTAQQATDDQNNPVLVKIDGKPVLRKEEFMDLANQTIKANPYLSSFGITSYESAPAQIRQQILDAVVQQKLIVEWGRTKGIDQTAEYKEQCAKVVESVKQALITQTFDKGIFENVVVSASDVTEAFEKNRDQMIKEQGAVKAVGVSFTSEEKAKVFYDLVANKQEDSFVNLAKESGVSVVDFGSIEFGPRAKNDSKVPAAVKGALMELAEGDYYAQAKEGDNYWVVQVTDRMQPTYYSLDEVREQLTTMVRHEKFKTVREEQVNKIRSNHTVDIDSSVLGESEDPMALLQQLLAARQGGADEALDEAAEQDDSNVA